MLTMIAIHMVVTLAGFFMMIPDLKFIRDTIKPDGKSFMKNLTTIWKQKYRLFLSTLSVVLSAQFFLTGLAVGLGRGISIAIIGIAITGANLMYQKSLEKKGK